MPGIGDLFRRVSRRRSGSEEPNPTPNPEGFESRSYPAPDAETGEAPSRPPGSEEEIRRGDSPDNAPLWDSAMGPRGAPEPERAEFHAGPTADTVMADALRSAPSVAVSDALPITAGDDVLHDDHLLVTCPYCGLDDQRVGSRCTNARCGQVIVRLPPWAQHRRQNWLARRFSWRRIITACIVALFIVFVIWINYPFAPNPTVLFKKTLTQMTIDSGPGAWAVAGRNLRHSRFVELGPPPPAGMVSAWNDAIPGDPLASEPVSQDGHIYVGSSAGVYALAPHDLSLVEKWEGETPGRITASAAVVGSHLFFGSTDHTINSWDAYDGHVRWSFPAEDTVEVPPMVADGLLYISSGESWVYALDAHSGTEIWRTQLESNASDAVAIHDGRLYVGDDKGIFYVLSARTGQEWFRFRTPRAITGSPTISADGERAYFTSGGQLYAVDARVREIPGLYQFKQIWAQLWWWQVPGVPRPQGQQGGLWRFTPENPLQGLKSSPALASDENGETIYAGSHDNVMYALDAMDGSLRWTFGANNDIWASPLVVKGQLIFGDDDGNLYSLNRDDGTLTWSINLGSRIRIPPTMIRGVLTVRTADGTVFSIE
ncbi:MAG: PQQ-binding-like beta-propeller repeat protein [Dehalococcoidia bacterium]|nr:PQQ-binding-like beta-propeller repeat protein [Dehalococcoidia bacterium]